MKRDLHAHNGVGEYWIVDPSDCSVQIFRLSKNRYEPAGYRRESRTIVTHFLPGLVLAVEKLFE